MQGILSVFNPSLLKDRWVVLGLIIFIILICWSGLVDHQAEGMVDDALFNSTLIYGSARVLNSVVSILQSVDVGAVVFTVSPFESLDPLNDLVERFSQVMTVALSSLALQKILLIITSSHVFNVWFSICAGFAVWAMFFAPIKACNALKAFWMFAFVRLALVLVIAANTLVDAVFLADSVEANQQEITVLQETLSSASSALSASEAGQTAPNDTDTMVSLREQLDGGEQVLNSLNAELEAIEAAIDTKKNEIDEIQSQYSMIQRANPFAEESSEVTEKKQALDTLEAERKALKGLFDAREDLNDELADKLECEQKRAEGGSCSLSEWAKSGLSMNNLKSAVQGVADSASNAVSNIIEMIALMVLKSILLPLLFAWGVYRSVLWLWKQPASRFGLDNNEPPAIEKSEL